MVFVSFSGYDKRKNYRVCSYGDQTMEECFELLSALVGDGWQLTRIELTDSYGGEVYLPIEAFDGARMLSTIKRLQKEWEEILAQQ